MAGESVHPVMLARAGSAKQPLIIDNGSGVISEHSLSKILVLGINDKICLFSESLKG